MFHDPVPMASRPPDTARTARSVFNLQSRYLALGDQLDDLLGGIDWDALDQFGTTPANLLFVLAMMTIFQFAEELSDRQAASVMRTRMDWKYALHLPADYPGMIPGALAEFRQRLGSNPTGRGIFRELLARLAGLGLLAEEASVATVLSTIESLNCLEEIDETMHLALEALASTDPDGLRALAQPYWYKHYGSIPSPCHAPHTQAEREAMLEALEADSSSLLATIADRAPALLQSPEVQALDRLWQRRFGPGNSILASNHLPVTPFGKPRTGRHGRRLQE